MNGGKNRQPLGYTIVEVMVVLAVSGIMFLIAAQFINGKQQKAAFTSGVNDMASQVQDVIEQVTDGKYSDIPLQCSAAGGSISVTSGGAAQGTNSQCVFLGKLFRFTSNSANYTISSLAGALLSGSVTPSLTNITPTIIDTLDTNQATPQSLQISGIAITDSNGTVYKNTYYNFGFVQGLGSSLNGAYESGGQTVSLVYAPAASGAPDSAINDHLATAEAVELCLSNGSQTDQLTLGNVANSQSSQLNVTTQYINPGRPCPS